MPIIEILQTQQVRRIRKLFRSEASIFLADTRFFISRWYLFSGWYPVLKYLVNCWRIKGRLLMCQRMKNVPVSTTFQNSHVSVFFSNIYSWKSGKIGKNTHFGHILLDCNEWAPLTFNLTLSNDSTFSLSLKSSKTREQMPQTDLPRAQTYSHP